MGFTRRSRLALVMACCTAILVSGCSMASPAGAPEAGDAAACAKWTKPKGMVTMKTSDFTLSLPKGWVNATKSESNKGAWASFVNKKSSGKLIDNIYLDRTTSGTDMSAAEMELALQNELRNAPFANIKVTSLKVAKPITLDGIKGVALIGKGKILGYKFNMLFLGVTNRKYRYAAAIAYTPGSSTGKAAFLTNLECSWKWTD